MRSLRAAPLQHNPPRSRHSSRTTQSKAVSPRKLQKHRVRLAPRIFPACLNLLGLSGSSSLWERERRTLRSDLPLAEKSTRTVFFSVFLLRPVTRSFQQPFRTAAGFLTSLSRDAPGHLALLWASSTALCPWKLLEERSSVYSARLRLRFSSRPRQWFYHTGG